MKNTLKSYQPRKQRKMIYEAPKHRRQKMMKAHLSDALYEKYGMRNLVVRKNDVVRVMRGKFKGHVGKVVEVNLKNMKIAVEGITIKRTDNKSVQLWLDPSKVMITKVDLSDPKRKEKIVKIAEERRGKFEEEEEEWMEEKEENEEAEEGEEEEKAEETEEQEEIGDEERVEEEEHEEVKEDE